MQIEKDKCLKNFMAPHKSTMTVRKEDRQEYLIKKRFRNLPGVQKISLVINEPLEITWI